MRKVKSSNTGLKLKKLRAIHGFEQKNLAKKLNISQSYYAKIEAFYSPNHSKFIPLLASIYKLNKKHLIEESVLDHVLENGIEFCRQYNILVES